MELLDLKNENILPFKFKKLKSGKIFISNDIGDRLILTFSEFKNFIEEPETINSDLKTRLISSNFIKPPEDVLDNYIKYLASRWLNRYNYIMQGPSLHIMVVTLGCNHTCKYCHASAKIDGTGKYDMTKEQAEKTIDVIFQTTSGSINIEFQGGEPLSNWEVVEHSIYYAREKNKYYNLNLSFSLVSNLTLMTEEKLDLLIADDISISTSIDGPEEVHNKNRPYVGNGGSFSITANWIKFINEKYKEKGFGRKVGAIATATKDLLDKYKEIVDTYIEIGLDSIFVRPINPYGVAPKNWSTIGYDYSEYKEFYDNMLDYISKINKEKGLNFKDAYTDSIYDHNLKNFSRVNYMEERSPCGAVLGQVAYNRDGGIYSCDEGRMLSEMGDESFRVEKLDGRPAEEIYKSMVINGVTKVMMDASIIDYLPGYDTNPVSNYIGTCPIYSYTVSGNINSKYKKEDRFRLQEHTMEYKLNFENNE